MGSKALIDGGFKVCEGPLISGRYLNRRNRFVVQVDMEGCSTFAYLPNPGRLWEILLPGTPLLLVPSKGELPYTVMAARRLDDWVLLHTHLVNDVVEHLLRKGFISRFAGAEIVKREVALGRSRIDFLLKMRGEEVFIEVKSCTLFGRHVAAFPDAVTARGKKHVEELAMLAGQGRKAAILFLINSAKPKAFIPDYHTDMEFARSLIAHHDTIDVIPIGVSWSDDMTLRLLSEDILVPWDFLKGEAKDEGAYITIFEFDEFHDIEVGSLGKIKLRPGFYAYVGSAARNLTAMVNRHSRKTKAHHWHVDFMCEVAKSVLSLPVRTQDDVECALASHLSAISSCAVEGFGSSDCSCRSHLFYFPIHPLKTSKFMDMLICFRFDRLWDKIKVQGQE